MPAENLATLRYRNELRPAGPRDVAALVNHPFGHAAQMLLYDVMRAHGDGGKQV